MKKIAFIIAHKEFRDEEYFITKEVLENNDVIVDTYSDEKGLAIGRFGGEVTVNHVMEDIDVNKYDGLVFAGGSGALECLDYEVSYGLINSFINNGKVVAAICISPVILAHAGVLSGKKATVWSSSMDKTAIKELGKVGAIYSDEPVIVDGKIITGRDYEASALFGSTIAGLR